MANLILNGVFILSASYLIGIYARVIFANPHLALLDKDNFQKRQKQLVGRSILVGTIIIVAFLIKAYLYY